MLVGYVIYACVFAIVFLVIVVTSGLIWVTKHTAKAIGRTHTWHKLTRKDGLSA